MALRADRFSAEVAFKVAPGTLDLDVNIIQHQACHCVTKIRFIPAAVTVIAVRIQTTYSFAGGMTSATIEMFVVAAEGPAGVLVREAGALLRVVAF